MKLRKKQIIAVAIAIMGWNVVFSAEDYATNKNVSGNWSDATKWDSEGVPPSSPSSNSHIEISENAIITKTDRTEYTDVIAITVSSNATLVFSDTVFFHAAPTIVVESGGSLVFKAGAVFQDNASITVKSGGAISNLANLSFGKDAYIKVETSASFCVSNNVTIGDQSSIRLNGTLVIAGDLIGGTTDSSYVKPKNDTPPGTLLVSGIISGKIGINSSISRSFHTSTWAGTTSTDWNTASNWSDGVPQTGDIIIVNKTTGNYPVVNSTVNISSLTINPGAELVLPSGKSLNIYGSLSILSDAANATGTLVNQGTLSVSGKTRVEQYLTSGRWWQISNPTTNGDASNFPGTKYVWDEATQAWATGASSNGKGFIVRPSSTSAATAGNLSTYFSGTLNTGTVSVTLSKTGTAKYTEDNMNYQGQNIVGNPYPAYLDFDSVKSANADITSTIHYYNNNGGGSYDTYNSASNVATGVATRYIPPMQAFWVTAESNGAVLSFKTNQLKTRATADGSSSNRLKSGSVEENKIVRLTVGRNGYTDENVIVFNPGAKNTFDEWDSPKMFADGNDSIPQIYTMVGNERLVINGLSSPDSIETIPVRFSTKKAGTFSIETHELSGFDGYTVQLYDSVLNKTQELKKNAVYSFVSDAVSASSRFSLRLKSESTTTETTTTSGNSAQIYTSGSTIIVSVPGTDPRGVVYVYNVLGQLVKEVSITSTTTEISAAGKPGSYLVKVQNGNSTATKMIEL